MHRLSGNTTTNQKIHIDVQKVPHHGSKRRTELAFFYHPSASVYLISDCSKAYSHPTVQILYNIKSRVVWAWPLLPACIARKGIRRKLSLGPDSVKL